MFKWLENGINRYEWMKTSLPTVNTVIVKKESHMNIPYSLALVPEMVFLCLNGHVLNP